MDKFDDIFKNRFNDGDVPIGDWNTPDDDLVWQGIAPHIPQHDDHRKYIWLWWGIGLLLLLLLGGLALAKIQSNTTVQVKESVEKKLTQVQTPERSTLKEDHSTNPYLEKLLPNDISAKIANHSLKNLHSVEKKSATSAVKNTTPQTKTPFATTAENYAKEGVQVFYKNSKIIDNQIVTTPKNNIDVKKLASEATNISTLNILSLNELAQKNTLKKQLKLDKLQADNNPNNVLLSASAGLVYWQHQISSQYTNDLSAFDFNYQDNWGWQTALIASIDLNNYFTPFVGIQYESIDVTSGHNSAISYEAANEQGTNANIYTQNLATPYGLTEATFRLDRNEVLMEESVALTVDFKSSHQIQNWSLPIGLQFFPLGKKNRFQLNTNMGLGINYLAGINNQLKDVDTHHALIQYAVDSPAVFNSPDINKWHFDVRLGAGVNYMMSGNLSINVQYNWARGLNSIFQQDDYATRINRHQLSIGLVKALYFR